MRYAFVCYLLLLLLSCASNEEKQERLARQQCGSCHLFTEPSLLDKQTWDRHVLPQMKFRMALDMSPLMDMNQDDVPYVIGTLPRSELVTHEQFESIRQYFLREAVPGRYPDGGGKIEEDLSKYAPIQPPLLEP